MPSPTQIGFNLLLYGSQQDFSVDQQINDPKGPASRTITAGVPVTQFKTVSAGYWVMFTCDINHDSSSFSPHLVLQFIAPLTVLYSNPYWIIDPYHIQVGNFIANGLPQTFLDNQLQWQMAAMQAATNLTNVINLCFYLFGYPTGSGIFSGNAAEAKDLPIILNRIVNAGGTITPVSVFADTSGNSVNPMDGSWWLATVPTILDSVGGLFVDLALLTDPYLRLIWNATANVLVFTRFVTTRHLQVLNSTGGVILDGVPIPGLRPLNFPSPQLPPGGTPIFYQPSAVFFDGFCGLITPKGQELITLNTASISFAGWFRASWLANAAEGVTNAILRFSQGTGGSTVFLDDSNLDSSGWHHFIGTVNGANQTGVLLVDGISTGITPQTNGGSFGTTPTDGVSVTIGTDGQGNFFIGDMSDLSIWYDQNWISGNTIQSNILNSFIEESTGAPLVISNAIASLGVPPHIYISGPAETATSCPVAIPYGTTQSRPVGGIFCLGYISGSSMLQDSTSAPTGFGPTL